MLTLFLAKARSVLSFEERFGVRPRSTPLGFSLPDYAQDAAGMDLWEKHYGKTARATPGSTPFSVVSQSQALADVNLQANGPSRGSH
jgi:hypothetical protein